MSQTSPDARAVVRALDALTTQVRRLADAHQTPTDDTPTTADDGPRCLCGDPIEQTGDPAYWIHSPGSDTPCLDARPALPARKVAHHIPAEAYAAWTEQAPDADEDAQRTARRDSLRNLLARLDRRQLHGDETDLLRQHVEAEIRDADTVRAVARGNLRHFRTIAAELEQEQAASRGLAGKIREQREFLAGVRGELAEAQAAIARVRAECAAMERDMQGSEDDGMRTAIVRVLAALDGTDQTTTEQPSTCTATIPDALGSAALHRCVAPAGHYDETDEPVCTGPEENRSPGGWHTDGEGHVWSDRAAAATPHREQQE